MRKLVGAAALIVSAMLTASCSAVELSNPFGGSETTASSKEGKKLAQIKVRDAAEFKEVLDNAGIECDPLMENEFILYCKLPGRKYQGSFSVTEDFGGKEAFYTSLACDDDSDSNGFYGINWYFKSNGKIPTEDLHHLADLFGGALWDHPMNVTCDRGGPTS